MGHELVKLYKNILQEHLASDYNLPVLNLDQQLIYWKDVVNRKEFQKPEILDAFWHLGC